MPHLNSKIKNSFCLNKQKEKLIGDCTFSFSWPIFGRENVKFSIFKTLIAWKWDKIKLLIFVLSKTRNILYLLSMRGVFQAGWFNPPKINIEHLTQFFLYCFLGKVSTCRILIWSKVSLRKAGFSTREWLQTWKYQIMNGLNVVKYVWDPSWNALMCKQRLEPCSASVLPKVVFVWVGFSLTK